MTTQNRSEDQWKTVLDTVSKFMLPFVLLALGWGYSFINKLEERIYVLQSTAVTEQKLSQTESRIMSYLDVRMGDLNTKLELILKQMELQARYTQSERR
ncbi:hypothetical protein D3C86_1732640 [compost metagenome]